MHSEFNASSPEKGDVRRLLEAVGFDRIGFARAGPTPGGELFREWLARGYAGEMAYLGRNVEKRLDPRRVLPGARTVIVAALHYERPQAPGIAFPDAARAEISAYARGTDYHRVLEKRLKKAAAALEERYGARSRWYADTGPVLEKAWAQAAGIGWIGKNTCSIDPQRGSYFFLGVILTTLELAPDPPAEDRCGACRLCLEACPTGAFAAPRVLDARRCISYLTIEHRGGIAPELEERMGNLVFGCDICQEVCPFNERAPRAGDPELAPRPENIAPPLAALAGFDEDAFRARFPRSAVRRARGRRFLRNVIIALGNAGRPDSLPLLDALALRDDVRADPVLQETLKRARRRIVASLDSEDAALEEAQTQEPEGKS